MRHLRTPGLAAAALAAALAVTAGCSENGSTNTASDSPASASPSASPTTGADPFGPACSSLPTTGAGSLADMAEQPVATAASRNPALSTLVTAVTKAGLADTLNNAEALTVFAPTDDAFAKIPADTLSKVLADKAALTKLLTYHVVGARQAPTDLTTGDLTTLQGGTVTAARSGEAYTVNDAKVVCGNVQTRNATVYLVDTVLMPKA
jgi:uncharacterized surface protein with fasciclin (FAS1) repeats